jgi:hypothetical protein
LISAGLDLTGLDLFGNRPRPPPTNSVPSAVAQRQNQGQTVVLGQRRARLWPAAPAPPRASRQIWPIASSRTLFRFNSADLVLQKPGQILHRGYRPHPSGRFQFSTGKRVQGEVFTPTSPAARMTARTDSTPFAVTFHPRQTARRFAQRPLPSMMMATCAGRLLLARRRKLRFSARGCAGESGDSNT